MSSVARLSAFPHVAREIMQQFKTEPVHLIGLTGTNSRGTSPLRHDRLTPSSFSKQAAQSASDDCPSTFANGNPRTAGQCTLCDRTLLQHPASGLMCALHQVCQYHGITNAFPTIGTKITLQLWQAT